MLRGLGIQAALHSVTSWDAGGSRDPVQVPQCDLHSAALVRRWHLSLAPLSLCLAAPPHSVPGVGIVDVVHQELCVGLEHGHPPACVSWEAVGCRCW